MSRRIEILKRAQRDLFAIPHEMRPRIDRALQKLAGNPYESGVKKLVGTRDFFRARIGDYRIIYRIVGDMIEINAVSHRKDVYR